MFKIRSSDTSDISWIESAVRGWGSSFVVSKGRKSYPQNSPCLIAEGADGSKAALLSYEPRPKNEAEITFLESFETGKGAAGQLVKEAVKLLKKKNIKRVFVVSTNNNYDAFKFYQYQGFRPVRVYPDAMKAARRLKPSIPKMCSNGLPINDEIEYELLLKPKLQTKIKKLNK